MNFVFMILLVLLILLFFNLYILDINSSYYTFLLMFTLLSHELYFVK